MGVYGMKCNLQHVYKRTHPLEMEIEKRSVLNPRIIEILIFESSNMKSSMIRVAFLGSKEVGYSTLNYLIQNAAILDIQLVAVLSNDRKIKAQDKSVLELAKSHAINILNSLDELLNLEPVDYLISVQYHQILKQKHIDCAKKLAINLHMAPIPEYRGCNQFSFAIIEQAKEFGTTLHVMETGIDSGDILFESRFPITEKENVSSLHLKTTQESIILFEKSIAAILRGNYQRKPQSDFQNIRKFGFHLRSEVNDIKQIIMTWDDEKIDRYIRATYFPPFPPPFTVINGQKIDLSPNWRKEVSR